jgi:hypothetical protein
MTPHRFPAAVVSRRTVRSFRARQASPQRHYTNGEGVLTHRQAVGVVTAQRLNGLRLPLPASAEINLFAVGLGPLKTWRDETPHCQDYDGANDCSNEPSALAGLIPPHRLT